MLDEHAPRATMGTAPSTENTAPSTLLMQPTVSMIPMITTKRKKGKISRAWKKSRTVLSALVDAYL